MNGAGGVSKGVICFGAATSLVFMVMWDVKDSVRIYSYTHDM